MPRIFLSYRRADSQNMTDRIYDHLIREFGFKNVFKDVDSIPLGADFRQVINEFVAITDVFLIVIGSKWVNATDQTGKRRLDNPDDLVRFEIESALEKSTIIIPIIIDGALIPSASELPYSIRGIVSRQALSVRPDPDFRFDIARLIHRIQMLDGIKSPIDEHKQNAAFTELLKYRGEIVLDYIRNQRESALLDAKRDLNSNKHCKEIQRHYDKAIKNFQTLHAQYLQAIDANKSQLAHEILGELYRLLYGCQYIRHEEPPRLSSP